MRRSTTLLALFALSGVSALIYQVAWVRQATLVFGVSVYAYSAVLAAFMGGTALGNVWAAARVDGRPRPLRLYARLQAGIALFGLASPFLLVGLMPLYASLARNLDLDSPLVTGLRVLFSIVVLVPPTFLMGATLPAMARAYAHSRGRVGSDVGRLYAAETLGAALGCGLSGLLLLRTLGTQQTIFLAAGLNLLAAAGAWTLAARGQATPPPAHPPQVSPTAAHRKPAGKRQKVASRRATGPFPFILAAYAVSGFAALGYEVVWARILAIFTLDAVFSFSIMLTTYLVGLTLGGWVGAWWLRRRPASLRTFGLLEAAVALAALLTIHIFGWMPNLSLETFFAEATVGRIMVYEFILGFLALIGPTALLGALFPVAVSLYTGEEPEQLGRRVGQLSAFNTAGAILGSLVTGFGLIPFLGLQWTGILLAAINLAIGVTALLWLGPRPVQIWFAPAGAAALALALVLARPSSLYLGFRQGPSEYLAFYKEGVETTVAVFDIPEQNFKVSFVNGRIEVPTDEISMRAFRLLGHLPALLRPDAQRALMLSFGNGVATGSLDTHKIPAIDAVDLSAEMLEAADIYWEENHQVLHSPRVQLHVEDGRNFLLRTPYRYDIITTDATHPTNASSWSLFTLEFYRSVAEHLTDNGVFIQWIPFHSLRESDYRMILRTFASVFPNATLWYTGGSHTLLVSTPQPLTDDTLDRLVAAAVQDPITAQDLQRPTALRAFVAMDTEALWAYAGHGPLSTDDRAYFLPDNRGVEQIRNHIQSIQTTTLEKGLGHE